MPVLSPSLQTNNLAYSDAFVDKVTMSMQETLIAMQIIVLRLVLLSLFGGSGDASGCISAHNLQDVR